MPQFHETRYGQIFLEHQLPQLIKQLTRIADSLERVNSEEKKKPIEE